MIWNRREGSPKGYLVKGYLQDQWFWRTSPEGLWEITILVSFDTSPTNDPPLQKDLFVLNHVKAF